SARDEGPLRARGSPAAHCPADRHVPRREAQDDRHLSRVRPVTKVYFAHPVSDYGTALQAAVLKELASSWHEVENPDSPQHQEGYRQHGMAYFEAIAATCDALAYLRFRDGTIGAGVAKEIAAAARAGRPIFEVRLR